MIQDFTNKKIMITGITGSWGNELTKQLLDLGVQTIVGYSRNEFAQFTMAKKFNNDERLKFVIGDVRDLDQLNRAMKDIDIVIHLAALKQIPVCEIYPYETIKTNILGVENVIKAANTNNVQKVINVSSDKATYPLNIYGMSKAIGEKLIVDANKKSSTQFVCVRGGNVLGSNGSVVPVFIDSILEKNQVNITDTKMTRFFLSLPEAIQLLLVASNTSIPGGIFVMKMPSCFILDLAQVLIKEYSCAEAEVKINEIGIRAGEKIHEVLINPYEAANTYKYGDNYYVISPTDIGLEKIDIKEYSSYNEHLLNHDEIKQLLIKGGFLKESTCE